MKSQEFPRPHDEEVIDREGIYEAEVVRIGFCPECGSTVITLGDHDGDVAFAHISMPVLDTMIEDLQSIRQRLRN